MVLITRGTDTIAPQAVVGYRSSRASGNLAHEVPGRANPDVTLRVAGLRTGTLKISFTAASAETDSRNAETILSGVGVLTLSAPERPSIAMFCTVMGDITRELDPDTRAFWTVEFGWQEVTI